MKVSEWKEMLSKLNDDDNLCIARPSQDFGIIRINYGTPLLYKKNEIDKSWELKEINKGKTQNADFVIY